MHLASASEALLTEVENGRRKLTLVFTGSIAPKEPGENSRVIWKATHDALTKTQLSSILPLEFDKVILGFGAVVSSGPEILH